MAKATGDKGKGGKRPEVDEPVEATPAPAPEGVTRAEKLWPMVTTAVTVGVGLLVGFVWMSDKFDDVGSDIAETKQEVVKLGARMDALEHRMDRLEDRFNAKFGDEQDGGTVPDASAPSPSWDPQHVARREKFCSKKCGADDACLKQCSADYNACGIMHPSDPTLNGFRHCVDVIK